MELKILVPTGDLVSVRRSVAYFLDTINRQAERQETVAAIGEDLFAIAVDQPFRFPAAFTFVLRCGWICSGGGGRGRGRWSDRGTLVRPPNHHAPTHPPS